MDPMRQTSCLKHGTSKDWSRLQTPLQHFMLPCLSARAVAAMRGCCRAFQPMIDQAPSEFLPSELRQLLPSLQVQQPKDSQAIQKQLRHHAACIGSVRAGHLSHVSAFQVITTSSCILKVGCWCKIRQHGPAVHLSLQCDER